MASFVSFRKRSVMGMTFTLAVGLLSACGGAGADNAGADSAAGKAAPASANEPVATAPKAEPVTIKFEVRNGVDEAGFNELYGNALRKKFPNYTIQYMRVDKGTSLPELVAANQPIDIYSQNARTIGIDLVGTGLQYDLTDMAKKSNIDMAAFEQEGIDQIKQVGGLYGLPVSSSVVALFYNKDIFDKFGVPYPKDGMTWDDTLELSKKLNRTEDGKTYVGYWIDTKPYLRNNQLSASFVDPKTMKASLNNDSWKRIVQTVYKDFAANDQMKSLLGKWPSKDIFLKDKIAAMYAEDFSKVFTTKEFNDMNWDMVALPTFKDLPKVGSQATYDYVTIPSFSKNKDQAMDVVKYLTSLEFQTLVSRQGYIPAIKDTSARNALGQDTKFKDKNLKSIFYNKIAKSAPVSKYDDFVAEDGLDKSQLRDAVNGTADVNTALRKAEEIANAKIEAAQGADKGK